MNDIYERFNRWIDKLQETEVETEREEPQSELHEKITRMLSWVIRRIVPLLLVMLAIELLIIFCITGRDRHVALVLAERSDSDSDSNIAVPAPSVLQPTFSLEINRNIKFVKT